MHSLSQTHIHVQTPGLLIGAVAPLLGVISPLLVELELYTKSRLLVCKCVCVHTSVYVYLFKIQVTTLCMKELCMSSSSSFLCHLYASVIVHGV